MKRRVICIAATALCMAMTSMAYAKKIETTTEDDEAYYTLEVKRKPYDIEKIASVVLGEDYQRDKEYERYWYNEEGTLEDELEHVEYYKTGYYRAYPMFGYSNWNWQYQDIYLESKFPEEGDEKDKKKAIDYGKKLMEDLDFSYSEISTYFMGIESVKALDMDIVAPGYTEVGYEEVNDREWSEEDGAWLMLFRGLDEVEGFPLSTQIIDNVTVMIWHPEYGLIYLEARPEFELIKKEPVQILPEDEAMEYFNKVTERYQVEAEEADVQDIDIVYIVDQTALDEKTSVLVPCFRYKFTCKGEAEDFFWANDTIIGSSQKQGEMLVNAVNGSTDSIFGSEFLK